MRRLERRSLRWPLVRTYGVLAVALAVVVIVMAPDVLALGGCLSVLARGPGITQIAQLVEQCAGPQMRVIGQPLRAVRRERLERARDRAGPDPYLAVAREIGTDGLAVSSQVPGDRRDRPTLATQCVHVGSVCGAPGGGRTVRRSTMA